MNNSSPVQEACVVLPFTLFIDANAHTHTLRRAHSSVEMIMLQIIKSDSEV